MHRFTQTVMRGEENNSLPCPECDHTAMPDPVRPKSIFDGIAGFSTLSKDTN
jgi:hypothetical protein